MKEKIKKIWNIIYSKILINPYVILFVVVALIMTPFIISKNYIIGNDTEFHISNIYSIYTNLLQGNISKILPIIAHGFGYGTGIFYPRLAHICAGILTFIFNGNIILALKVTHFAVYFLSGIMMYKLVYKVFSNKYCAIISSIFYITFPYSITEVFVRDALAESFMFIFIPMILLGLYELFYGNKKAFYIWFIIGYVGMLNSHLVLSVYFTALVSVYLLLNIKKIFKKENFKALVISSILILLLTSSFTIPLLEHKLLGIYTVFEGESMSNRGTIVNSTMGVKDFLVQKPSKDFSLITYYLNLLALLLACIAVIFNKKILKENNQRNFFKFLLIIICIILFLMSKFCPWILLPKMMVMIQFVWRLETILVLCLSILAGILFKKLKQRSLKIIILITILIFNGYMVYNAYNFEMFKQINIQDIDLSGRGMGWEREYLPISTGQNTEYFENRDETIIVKKGKAEITILENVAPNLTATIKECDEETVLELPRIYYLGYEAKIIDNNGEKTKLDLYINENGFIETKINSNGTLVLEYTGTTLNKIANIVSLSTLAGIFIYINIKCYKNKKK